MSSTDQNKLALISCIELVLMKSGNQKYNLVVARLNALYDAGLRDCYDHPDYLRMTLKEVYENNYQSIINEVKMCLDDLLMEKDISQFISKMENPGLGSQ